MSVARFQWIVLALLLSVSAVDGHAAPRDADDTGSVQRFAPDLQRAFAHASTRAFTVDVPTEIALVFHVLSGPDGEGNLSDAKLQEQLDVLNEAYRASGFHFHQAETRRYPNSAYFAGGCFPTTETGLRMKVELAADPASFVNVYFCKLQLPYIAGYGTLPDEYAESDHRHGVVVDSGTVPGSNALVGRGHTLVHEIGHYFGLLHTFQGGCAEPGDGVADTPPEASAAYDCSIGRDTCAGDGPDPVTNFMDYSDDVCTDRFTPLQANRMHALVAAYRPSLGAGKFIAGAGMTGNWYNPAQSGHGFSVEILPNRQMILEWFVFAPGGGPTWIVAAGPVIDDGAVLQGYQRTGSGGVFPPRFDPTRLQSQWWGTITLRFSDCDTGTISWQPALPDYEAGSMIVKRLTLPAGLSCP